MHYARRHFAWLPLLAGAVALLGLSAVAAREARATCGDYLYHGPMRTTQSSEAPADRDSAPLQPDCHGRGCRDGNPPIQVPPRTPVPTQRVDQYAIAGGELLPDDAPAFFQRADSAAAASRGHRLRIDRPPRS